MSIFDSSMIEKGILKQLNPMPEVIIIRCDRCESLREDDDIFLKEHNCLKEAFCKRYQEELASRISKELMEIVFRK